MAPKQKHVSSGPPSRRSKKASSTSLEPVVSPCLWTEKEKENLRDFKAWEICPTRMISTNVLAQLGLKEDVVGMLDRMGMGYFARKHLKTFPRFVRSFLATVELTYVNPKAKTASEGTLSFKHEDSRYTLPIFAICEYFGFEMSNGVKFPLLKCANEFWDLIAFGDYKMASAKCSKIRNPSLRIVHKLLANTIFARSDMSMVRRDELNLLFQALKHSVRDKNGNLFEDYLGNDVNLGCLLASELVYIRENVKKGLRSPDNAYLFIGGLVIGIMERAGIDFTEIPNGRLPTILNRDYLIKCRILKWVSDKNMYVYQYMWSDKANRTINLPNQGLTSLDSNANIAFLHEGTLEEDPVASQQAVPPNPETSQPDERSEDQSASDLRKQCQAQGKVIKTQGKMIRWCVKMIKGLKRKLKRTPGYVSSEEDNNEEGVSEEDEEEEEEQRDGDGDAEEEHGDDADHDAWYRADMALDDDTLQTFMHTTKRKRHEARGDAGASSSNPHL